MKTRLLKPVLWFPLFFLCLLPACTDEPSGPEAAEIRLRFATNPGAIFFYSDTTAPVPMDIISLYRFNKANYHHVDSAVLMVLLDPGSPQETTPGVTYLYDYTNGQIIPNSRIENASSDTEWLSSGNIWDDLPNGNLTLGLTVQGSVYEAFIVIY
ncbi:MAG: hypothetical protein AB7H80_01150 [Candidatus Kapaibacterium sp.]